MSSVFESCDCMVRELEHAIAHPVTEPSNVYYTGVDLGTACVMLVVLDEDRRPVAGAYRYADVVRDGMVVDYIGAIRLVRELKEELEEKLGAQLLYAAASIPPGTEELDSGTIRHVVQGAGFELTALPDEPTAANAVLGIKNGVVVDIGGGTTGISILKDGNVVYVADEATGGTHFSLVVSGAYHMSFEEADIYKRKEEHQKELLPVLKPVIEKVASIIRDSIQEYEGKDDVEGIYLVGGTSCLAGIEQVIEKYTNIPTYKPENPMFVTPLGIALYCTQNAWE